MRSWTVVVFLFILLFTSRVDIWAQSDGEEEENEPPSIEDTYYYSMNQAGDQFIKIGIDIEFAIKPENLNTGGEGILGYHRFLTPHFALGFDVSFGYSPTIGSNVFTYIPFVFNATYQPTWRRLEFPITIGVGFAVENYMDMTYFPGLIVKPELGICYRMTANWSLGLQGNYIWMPQYFYKKEKRQYNYNKGSLAGVGIVARYHF